MAMSFAIEIFLLQPSNDFSFSFHFDWLNQNDVCSYEYLLARRGSTVHDHCKKDIKVNQDHINKKGGSSSKIKMMGSGYQKKSQDYHSRKISHYCRWRASERPAVERVDPRDILASKGFASIPSDIVHLSLSLLLLPFFLMAIDEGIGSYHPT